VQNPESTGHWNVDAFIAFWKRPDASRAIGALTNDIVGHWPRQIGTIRGAQPYVDVIAAMLKVSPDFSLSVREHAASGNYAFIRWVAKGTGPDGPFEFTGCDRVQTRDGYVCENYVFCDDPFFDKVAEEIGHRKT